MEKIKQEKIAMQNKKLQLFKKKKGIQESTDKNKLDENIYKGVKERV